MALDIAPGVVVKGEPVTIGRTSGGLGSFQGLRTVRYGGERVVVDSWSSTEVGVTVPSGSHLANSDAGYRFTISGLLSGTDQSEPIPLEPSEGWDFIEPESPVIDDGSILRDSQISIGSGEQVVFLEFPGLTIGADTQFSFDPMPENEVAIPYFVIGWRYTWRRIVHVQP